MPAGSFPCRWRNCHVLCNYVSIAEAALEHVRRIHDAGTTELKHLARDLPGHLGRMTGSEYAAHVQRLWQRIASRRGVVKLLGHFVVQRTRCRQACLGPSDFGLN